MNDLKITLEIRKQRHQQKLEEYKNCCVNTKDKFDLATKARLIAKEESKIKLIDEFIKDYYNNLIG